MNKRGKAEVWIDANGETQRGVLHEADGNEVELVAYTHIGIMTDSILIHRYMDGHIDDMPLFRYFPRPGKVTFYSWVDDDILDEIKIHNDGDMSLKVVNRREYIIQPGEEMVVWRAKE